MSSKKPCANLTTEIVAAALEAAGHQLQLEVLPWTKCESDVLSGKYVGTFPYAKNAEREARYKFSTPIYQSQDVIFLNKNNTNFLDAHKANFKGGLLALFVVIIGMPAPSPLKLKTHDQQSGKCVETTPYQSNRRPPGV